MATIASPTTKLISAPQHISNVVPDAPCQLDTKLCTATYTISSMAVDNDGDILVPEGSLPHLDRYRNNPVVLWDHDAHMIPIAQSINPVSKSLSWDVFDQNCVKATAVFHLMTQESVQCWALIEAGVLRGSSVGYDAVPGKSLRLGGGGIKFVEWAPHEWSVVPIPCNPEALLDDINRNWDGKSLSPSIIKSMMRYAPENKTARVIVPMVVARKYVKSSVPWAVESSSQAVVKTPVQSINKIAKTAKESKAMADEQVTPDETGGAVETETVQHPPGAQAVMGFCADLESALANLNAALPMIEKEPILELFESVGLAIGEQVEVLKAKLAEVYPDLKSEKADDEEEEAEVDEIDDGTGAEEEVEEDVVEEEEKSDEEDGDEEDEEDKPKEKVKAKVTKKSLAKSDHAPHIASIQDAGELVKEMGDSPNVPKSYRMACKSAHSGLSSACEYITKTFAIKADGEVVEEKPTNEKAEDDEEAVEEVKADDDAEEVSADDMKAIKALQADLATLRKGITRMAGKVQ